MQGLTTAQVEEKRKKYGVNQLEEKKQHPLVKLLLCFWGPIPWMIEVAIILSLIVHDHNNAMLIAALLIINSGISFWEEYKADKAIALLKKKLALQANVLRNGKWQTIPASELVPDDIVALKLGDIVPADIKMLDGENVAADQSTLTGESLPVDKTKGDTLYSSSIVYRGNLTAQVISIGNNTFFGKTAKLVSQAKNVSHFQQAVLRIGRFLIISTLVLAAIILVTEWLRDAKLLQTFQFLLILVIAAIPVAMPAVLSVTMAVGAAQLAKLKAIVSRLVSIEELAGMNILCSDKTGTLTENKLEIKNIYPFGELKDEDILFYAAATCNQQTPDVIDKLILNSVTEKDKLKKLEIKSFVPFDPVSKRSSATVTEANKTYTVTKGAPQIILDLAKTLSTDEKSKAKQDIDDLAKKGFRTLGVARAVEKDKWEFCGLIAFYDPPRKDSKAMLAEAKKYGVNVKMLTGDNVAIAKETASQLGLGTNILAANDLAKLKGAEKTKTINTMDGVAEVFPESKYDIVSGLQKENYIVGMTGDGVNDAPSLKQANIGIAVSGATDAARSAADLVLAAPGLSVIITALTKARQIFQRMNAYAIYRIAETLRVLIFLSLSILFFRFYPLTVIMLIVIALLNDIPIMTIAYDNARVMSQPVSWHMRSVLTVAFTLGVTGVIASFGLLWFAKAHLLLNDDHLRTLMFLKMTASGHMTLYLARTGGKPFYAKPWPAPILFFTTETTQIIGTLFAVYGWFMTPIGWKLALMVWGYALIVFVLTDQIKRLAYWGLHKEK